QTPGLLHLQHQLLQSHLVDPGAEAGPFQPGVHSRALDQIAHRAHRGPSKRSRTLTHNLQPGEETHGSAVAQELRVHQDEVAATQRSGLLYELHGIVGAERGYNF
ncbi:hypothetical protein Vretifemale_8434, partial [Volvox reticuliferus]